MNLFIVILHYGDIAKTNLCLISVKSYIKTYEEIVIVDNQGNFNTSEKGKIKVIKNKRNLGYSGGMNVGIKYSQSKGSNYILLLNNDTKLKSDIASPLTRFLAGNKQAVIASPAIKFKKGNKTVYDLGGKVNLVFGKTSHNEVEKNTPKEPIKVDYVSGCCMMIKEEVFSKLGYFDERFFLYYEDVDFSLRAREKGYLIYVVPSAVIDHDLSGTIGKNTKQAIYYQTRSALIFGRKNLGLNIAFQMLFIIYQSLIFLIRSPKNGSAAFEAMFDFLKK